jgi:hypothetical protein
MGDVVKHVYDPSELQVTGAIPMNRYCGILLLLFVFAETGAAPDPKACLAIEDAAARLACYDAAFERAPLTAAGAATTEFGMNDRLRREKDGGSPKDTAPAEISASVATASRNPQGYYTLELDNGQRWYVSEAAPAQAFRQGDVVTIRRAALGSYLLTRSRGGESLRAKRIG